METLLAEITSRVESQLSAWYGPDAKLVRVPTTQLRNWSIFVRYVVRASATGQQPVLVKIRRRPEMSLQQAIADPALKAEGQDDYAALQAIEAFFQGELDEARFCAVHPLAFFDEWSMLVMEELDAPPLRHRLIDPRMTILPAWQRRVETLLGRAGRWLRIYHEKLGELREAPFFSERIDRGFEQFLTELAQSNPRLDVASIRKVVEGIHEKRKDSLLPYGLLHWNFNCTNILVTRDDRLGVLDPHFIPGPIYADLSKVITDLETYSMQVLAYGLYIQPAVMRKLREAVLRGYFGEQLYDREALAFFCLYSVLEKWQRDEEAVQKTGQGWKLLRQRIQSLVLWRRKYFMKLADQYVRNLLKEAR